MELGAGGALNKIEKARKVMKERMGEVRTWDELPVSLWSTNDHCKYKH